MLCHVMDVKREREILHSTRFVILQYPLVFYDYNG
jgi:putative NADPH-quinone reductase